MLRSRFRTLNFIIISFFVLIFQATWSDVISLGPLRPDLVLILVIFFSLFCGAKEGLFCGMILGFGVDALGCAIVGLNCLILGSIGFFAGLLKDRIYRAHPLTKILIVLIAQIYSILIYYIFAARFFHMLAFWQQWSVLMGNIIYTTLFNLIFYKTMEKLFIIKGEVIL